MPPAGVRVLPPFILFFGDSHTPGARAPRGVGCPRSSLRASLSTDRGCRGRSPAGVQGCPWPFIQIKDSPPARGRGRGWVYVCLPTNREVQ